MAAYILALTHVVLLLFSYLLPRTILSFLDFPHSLGLASIDSLFYPGHWCRDRAWRLWNVKAVFLSPIAEKGHREEACHF